ncbi:hypothetical protein PBCV1_A404R [Paramecium bursaria Chlorella virus 1]|uniref:Uncharacterized protein n=1 Tax=Paramecium bursaria Chlorella virus 1 TaxID=10506 RepID=Q98456_PBCV1|nr:hypothetical protein PBCV1_A404R [Paramecium bursaria Chlorella virus 1]AAC96772.2 hypothetical protein [Paramecium bursaria Chlorella virus 1]
MMAVEKYLTLENILKVLLAVAVGFMLYKIFFKKNETYYNYQSPDGDESGYAYPMDYEDEPQEMIDEYAAEDVPDYEDDEVVEEVVEDYEDDEVVEEVVEDYEEDDEVVVDDDADDAEYDYEDTDAYDDSAEQVDDAGDAEDDFEVPDEVYEEADAENTDAYEYLYADDVADELQENFTLYSNLVGVDTSYD